MLVLAAQVQDGDKVPSLHNVLPPLEQPATPPCQLQQPLCARAGCTKASPITTSIKNLFILNLLINFMW